MEKTYRCPVCGQKEGNCSHNKKEDAMIVTNDEPFRTKMKVIYKEHQERALIYVHSLEFCCDKMSNAFLSSHERAVFIDNNYCYLRYQDGKAINCCPFCGSEIEVHAPVPKDHPNYPVVLCPVCNKKGETIPLICDPEKRLGEVFCKNCGWYNWREVSSKYIQKN